MEVRIQVGPTFKLRAALPLYTEKLAYTGLLWVDIGACRGQSTLNDTEELSASILNICFERLYSVRLTSAA